LSSDEAELLEHYRGLTESDQVAMRYLIGAMKDRVAVLNRAHTGMWW
jgi:hypothetical protein